MHSNIINRSTEHGYASAANVQRLHMPSTSKVRSVPQLFTNQASGMFNKPSTASTTAISDVIITHKDTFHNRPLTFKVCVASLHQSFRRLLQIKTFHHFFQCQLANRNLHRTKYIRIKIRFNSSIAQHLCRIREAIIIQFCRINTQPVKRLLGTFPKLAVNQKNGPCLSVRMKIQPVHAVLLTRKIFCDYNGA